MATLRRIPIPPPILHHAFVQAPEALPVCPEPHLGLLRAGALSVTDCDATFVLYFVLTLCTHDKGEAVLVNAATPKRSEHVARSGLQLARRCK